MLYYLFRKMLTIMLLLLYRMMMISLVFTMILIQSNFRQCFMKFNGIDATAVIGLNKEESKFSILFEHIKEVEIEFNFTFKSIAN